jgi:spore photoproduct lyase
MTTQRDVAAPTTRPHRLWLPKRVLVTAAAAEQPHTAEILRRSEAAGVEEITLLPSNRLTGLTRGSERETYAYAKSTLAVVVAPPSALKPQPIPPSADWRIDLARGCPAHCQYCYLAGSLSGPPVTRVYANLDDVLAGVRTHAGRGSVTSGTAERGHEGTTFEMSCYTDPLGIEHLTGSLSAAISRVGTGELGDDASLRFTTKFDAVDGLLGLPHGRRTRMRVSVNAAEVGDRFEGGTAPMAARIAALRSVALAGYRVGLTIAPVMPVPEWRTAYGRLLDDVAAVTAGIPDLDLTTEIITHRFTPGSKDVLLEWYPRTKLEMDEEQRSEKRNKFGGVKYVYPREVMREMRDWFTDAVEQRLPGAALLYWT